VGSPLWSKEDFTHQTDGQQEITIASIKRIEHDGTDVASAVLDALPKSNTPFTGECLIVAQALSTQTPPDQGKRIRTPIRQPKILLAQMRPNRIGIEHAAGDWRIATLGHLLQQGIGDPTVSGQARVDLSGPKQVSHHLPPVNAVQSSACQSGDDIEAQSTFLDGSDQY
jgi:hypothetical protein